jgi:hypothetical protein
MEQENGTRNGTRKWNEKMQQENGTRQWNITWSKKMEQGSEQDNRTRT